MAFEILDNFKLLKAKPLDSRLVINDLSDIPVYARYNGMIVYQLSDETFYKYQRGVFSTMNEMEGSTTINSRSGNVILVEGSGVDITEVSTGTFRFSLNGDILKSDGSIQMIEGYIPTEPKDIVTKEYVDQKMSEVISPETANDIMNELSNKLNISHADVIASETTSGHSKIDNASIKKDNDDKIYVAVTDGGVF